MSPAPNQDTPDWRWDNTYTRLPGLFFERSRPIPVRSPDLVMLNERLAETLGLDPNALVDPGVFTGNVIPEGADPIAQAYAGHQFGHFTGLGDGRAILLGEHIASDGSRVDIQLKGSGRTRFSRGGDGRAALGPMLREYLISEAMHALGIPTTRSLAVATTGEEVFRTEVQRGAVLTRVAASHIRVGTFQWAAAHEDLEALKALVDYTIRRHFPNALESENPCHTMLKSAMERQASLIAKWMSVGFIHGVMNTDNMALSGETIDYGPCAFMDRYDPDTVFSSIDRNGRYAYGNQPSIARWNLARLAEALLPVLDPNQKIAVDLANEILGAFEARFQEHWLAGMRSKIGLFNEEEDDAFLIHAFLEWMKESKLDFTNTFRSLGADGALQAPPFEDGKFTDWHGKWSLRLQRQPQSASDVIGKMSASNPSVIPRNHKVEEALSAASDRNDLDVFRRLLEVLASPFDSEKPEEYQQPQPAGSVPYQTFCGT